MTVRTKTNYRNDPNPSGGVRSEHIASLPAGGFIREKRLLHDLVPFSRATLWRNVANGTFPRPVKLSSRVTAWPVESIRGWMAALKNEASGDSHD
ncbi:helix-turn-helix transcriptional regulator [Eoetvoesiella caeni]